MCQDALRRVLKMLERPIVGRRTLSLLQRPSVRLRQVKGAVQAAKANLQK